MDSASRPRYYSRFYSRRALRILPAYYLLIVVLVLLGRTSFVTQRTSWAFAGLSVVYLSNITPLLGVPRDYAPLWSLAVEEHFYLVWPAGVRMLKRGGLVIVAILICAIEPILRAFSVARGGLWGGPYTWLSADGLALGALLALFARSIRGSRANVLKLASLSVLVGILALAASLAVLRFVSISLRATGVNYVVLSLLAVVLWLGTGSYRRLVLRILAFYGFISYGLYLIHALIFSLYNNVSVRFVPAFYVGHSFRKCLLRLLIVLIIATTVAYASRVTFEEFFLRRKNKLEKQRAIPQPAQCTEPLLPT